MLELDLAMAEPECGDCWWASLSEDQRMDSANIDRGCSKRCGMHQKRYEELLANFTPFNTSDARTAPGVTFTGLETSVPTV